MAKSKTTANARRRAGELVSVGTALVPVPEHARALESLPRTEPPTILREQGTTLVVGQPYRAGALTIPADEVYYVDDLRRERGEGRWLGEADKVAWRDPETGFECIMLRATEGGYLGGYVAVPPTHPLYGFEQDALPVDLGVEVHGGLTYARACAEGPSPTRRLTAESRRICHVARPPRYEPLTHATDYRVSHDDAWWFGFTCDHVYDLVPNARRDRDRFLAREVGGTYRDDEYVCREVGHLARQLRAVADGAPMPERDGPPPPPLGLDPERGA